MLSACDPLKQFKDYHGHSPTDPVVDLASLSQTQSVWTTLTVRKGSKWPMLGGQWKCQLKFFRLFCLSYLYLIPLLKLWNLMFGIWTLIPPLPPPSFSLPPFHIPPTSPLSFPSLLLFSFTFFSFLFFFYCFFFFFLLFSVLFLSFF